MADNETAAGMTMLPSVLSGQDTSTAGTNTSSEGMNPFADEKYHEANRKIVEYLLRDVAEYRELDAVRKEVSSQSLHSVMNCGDTDSLAILQQKTNPDDDGFLNADNPSDHMAQYFYQLTRSTAWEMHIPTDAFTIKHGGGTEPPRILDMCMAPGGFLELALEMTRGASALAFTLPVSQGGHGILLPRNANAEIRLLDVTLLAVDMGVSDIDIIPHDHPDACNFLPRQLQPNRLFDLALCDGQVLRTQNRAAYRENREAHRLITTQLALSLQHLRPGSTMVVLLHKLEDWNTIQLIRLFETFSLVRLFKPTTAHAKKSLFYMVATDVQSQCPEAVQAIENWKKVWRVATFGTDEECREALSDGALDVDHVLKEFGTTLVSLGRNIWKVQADAMVADSASYRRDNQVGPRRRNAMVVGMM